MRFATAVMHAGHSPDGGVGSTNVPIFEATAFAHSAAELAEIFAGRKFGYTYTRLGNPTVAALETRLAALEGGDGAVASASGMAAIASTVLSLVRPGEEIVAAPGIFGGTVSLFQRLAEFGIGVGYAESVETAAFASLINDRTRLIFVESIGNPSLDVPNLEALAALAHQHALPLVVDNTVATPYLVRPLQLGADIVIHSTSKYINGNGGAMGGVIVAGGKFAWDHRLFAGLKSQAGFGPSVYLAELRRGFFKDLGGCLSPFNAFLTIMGLETLALRMERASDNALQLAESLLGHPAVAAIRYPGLPKDPSWLAAKAQFAHGRFGALMTIRTGTREKAFRFINKLHYASNQTNIGDVRTMVVHPASTIGAANSEEERATMGIHPDLVRLNLPALKDGDSGETLGTASQVQRP